MLFLDKQKVIYICTTIWKCIIKSALSNKVLNVAFSIVHLLFFLFISLTVFHFETKFVHMRIPRVSYLRVNSLTVERVNKILWRSLGMLEHFLFPFGEFYLFFFLFFNFIFVILFSHSINVFMNFLYPRLIDIGEQSFIESWINLFTN